MHAEIAEHLALRTPLLWVVTDEPSRALDAVVKTSSRTIFRLDPLKGLLSYDHKRNRWITVLVTDEEGNTSPVFDPSVAFQKVLDERGIFILENAHKRADALANFFLALSLQYREGFYEDNLDKIPASFVLLSHEASPPPEIARNATIITHELPDKEELRHIINHLREHVPIEQEEEEVLLRSGLGMSETEFVSSAIRSAKRNGSAKAADVNADKVRLLKKSSVLDIRRPEVSLDELGGLDKTKTLVTQISWIWNNPQVAEEIGIEPLRRLLLVGVSGSGKSLICEAIASTLKLDLGKGGISQSMSKWVGESEKNMRATFAALRRMAPIVFWIDEFGRDMSGGMSSGTTDSGTTNRVHAEFLTGVQELPQDVFLVAAANRIDDLPPEMLRADRFDRIMFVGFPTEEERREIFRIHLGIHANNYDTHSLARMTPYFTGAEIKSLIKEARFETGTKYQRHPTAEEIISAAKSLKGRVWVNKRNEVVSMYERALVEWAWASSFQEAEASELLKAAKSNPTSVSTYVPQQKKKSFVPKFDQS